MIICYHKDRMRNGFFLQIRLPENEVQLSAFVVPFAEQGHKYQYEWTLLAQPPGNPIKDQNEGVLRLSKLSEGLYTFKVRPNI